MKKISLLLLTIVTFTVTAIFAQSPQSFKYQAVARNSTGDILANQNISVRISIRETSPGGTVVYEEEHVSFTTNEFGLVNLEIGTGSWISGNFSLIDWGSNSHFIEIEMDENGGTAYSVMGTAQLLSVPYALHAENVTNDNVDDADANPTNELQAISISNDTIYLSNGGFVALPSPVAETDPVFGSSVAGGITGTDTTNWNNKLDSYTETDPVYGSSVASGITGTDTTDWNNKLDVEVDGDVSNELQVLSFSNDTLYLSNGGQIYFGNYSNYDPYSFICGTDSIQDADGNWYNTVKIGGQCWMAENLNAGTQIFSFSVSDNQTDNDTIEKYCYNNNPANCATFGGFYQWNEAMQYIIIEGTQGVCPVGWHIPTDWEWKELEKALGMTSAATNLTGWRGTDEGTKLKQGGSSGFESLLAGYRSTDGLFYNSGTSTYFWSSTGSGAIAWLRYLLVSSATVNRNTYNKLGGLSVRCLKD